MIFYVMWSTSVKIDAVITFSDIDETMYHNCGCEDRCENRYPDDDATGNKWYECYCDSPKFIVGRNDHSCEGKNV